MQGTTAFSFGCDATRFCLEPTLCIRWVWDTSLLLWKASRNDDVAINKVSDLRLALQASRSGSSLIEAAEVRPAQTYEDKLWKGGKEFSFHHAQTAVPPPG